VSKAHIDFMVSAGLDRRRNVLRWYDVDPAQEMEEDCYQEGSWIGPGALRWHQEHARELRLDTADRVGQMLWVENQRSVNHRYAEQELEEFYTFKEVARPHPPDVILNACACYVYQSCEHPGWWRSEARQFVFALEKYAISRITEKSKGWSIDEEDITYETGISIMQMAQMKRKRTTN
jgi:hypothetical protein